MKTVIITGATGNLGTAVTDVFLQAGYTVVATVSNPAALTELPQHENMHGVSVNLTNTAETELFVTDTINKFKKIDAALMLVGGFAMGNIEATKLTNIQQQIALNFETAYNVVQPVYQHMKQQNNGRLVFIGARPALQPADGKNLIAYGLSKSLLFKLAEFINADAKGTNVTATVVAPSTLDTEINRKSMPDTNPDNWVKPQALAEILEFICSEKAAVLRETVLKVYNNA